MFPKKEKIDLESYLKRFSHCWLKFHSSGDYYVARIGQWFFDSNGLTIQSWKMSRCREFIIDVASGEKKWFPVKHYDDYSMRNIDVESFRAEFAKMNPDEKSDTIKFRMQNGDEFIFTSNAMTIAQIEDILNTTL